MRADMAAFDAHRLQIAGEQAIDQIRRQMVRHVMVMQRQIQAGDPIAGCRDGSQIMTDKHNRQTHFRLKGQNRFDELLLAAAIDARGWLVEQKQPWTRSQRAGDQARCNWPPEIEPMGLSAKSAMPSRDRSESAKSRSSRR